MTELESQLLVALQALEASVGQPSTPTSRPDVRPHLAEINRLVSALPSGLDPELKHYLERRSYEKARLFLEGRNEEIARGGCQRTAR